MKRAIILTAAILWAAAPYPADTESDINSLDAQRLGALIRGDVQALERLLSKDLIYTHASGWRQTKTEFLASLRSGELVYHTFAMRGRNIHVYPDAVIVTGNADAQVRSKGQELNVSLLFLEVYVKQEGRWQLAAWQSTRSAP